MNALLRYGALVMCALVIGAISSSVASAERRVALVIGNAKYEHADTLANTINDADAMTQLFTHAGFDVVEERRDIGVVEFKRAAREFLNTAQNADIAVVYYSGHGIEVGGTNYLIPVDAKLLSVYDVDDEAVPLDRLLLATQPARKLSLIILDACRENPFLRAEGRLPATRAVAARLIGVEPTSADTLVAYAAKAGSLSYDGAGPNSPFTTALVRYITQPGLDIRIALGKVRDDVLENTNNRQEPFVYGSLGGGDISLTPAPSPPNTPTVVDSNVAAAVDYQMAERLGSLDGWRAFLAAHRSGYYSELARAQLAKLGDADASKTNGPSAAKEPALRPVDGKNPPVGAGGPQPKPQDEVAHQVAPEPPSPDSKCKRDAGRLAQLRRNPSPEEVEKFAREMECESLRPQVKRLMESLSVEPVAAAAPQESPLSAAQSKQQACGRAAVELERLRANPAADQVAQFARALDCDQLRPQVQRLMESLGVKAIGAAAGAAPAPSPIAPKEASGASDAVKQAQNVEVCKHEADELSRIRANPDRDAAQRFASELKCNSLRPQAARLLESIGD
jgi:hypothetical protein